MIYKTIICISYPHQLFPALVALNHHRKNCMHEPLEQPTLIYLKLHNKNERSRCFITAILELIKDFAWLKLKISFAWKLGVVKEYDLPVAWRALYLRWHFRKVAFQEIIYAHDLSSDFFIQTVMHAFPKSKRLCFGDSLGIVYKQKFFVNSRYAIAGFNFLNKLKKLRRSFLLPAKSLEAHTAILILPFDPGGDFLKTVHLEVPTKNEVQMVLSLLSKNLSNQKLEKLLTRGPKKVVLMVLNNFYESKLASFESELSLYQELIRDHVPQDAILILKPHPGSNLESLANFKRELRHQELYFLEEMDVYPLELNQALISKSDLILSMSYSSISIPYLYGKPVKHVLSTFLIKKYFYPEAFIWVEESNQQYLNLIASLPTWDGKSPL